MHGARKKTCQALQRFQCHPQRKRHRRRPELHFGGHSLGGPALSWITDPSLPGREGRLQAEKRQVAEAGWKPPALQGRARPGMGRDTITQGQGLPSPGATRASPGASRAPSGLFQASLQLPASPEILRLLCLETRPSGRCPSLPVCPRPTPTSLCASVPLLCLEDVGPKPGTEGSPLRPGQSFADDVFVKS